MAINKNEQQMFCNLLFWNLASHSFYEASKLDLTKVDMKRQIKKLHKKLQQKQQNIT